MFLFILIFCVQIDLHQACERIAQHGSPADIFHAVLEGAGRLNGEDNSFHDLAGQLSGNTELANVRIISPFYMYIFQSFHAFADNRLSLQSTS